jgi:hypothetical protein
MMTTGDCNKTTMEPLQLQPKQDDRDRNHYGHHDGHHHTTTVTQPMAIPKLQAIHQLGLAPNGLARWPGGL